MLGLAEQVGGDRRRARGAVGDDQQLARAGRHVDGRAARQRGDEGLRLGHPGIAGAANLVDGGNVARPEGESRDRLGAARGPDRLDPANLGRERDDGVEPAVRPRRSDRHDFTDPRRPRRQGEHQQGGEERGPAAGYVEADPVDRPPDLAHRQARHRLDPMLGGKAAFVEGSDVGGGELDRLDLLRCKAPAGLGGGRSDRHEPRKLAVEPKRLGGKPRPAAAPDVLDDRPHRSLQRRVGALRRPCQRLAPAGGVEPAPVENLHIIIFSMGRTRMAEAPAAFSFWRVSQKRIPGTRREPRNGRPGHGAAIWSAPRRPGGAP